MSSNKKLCLRSDQKRQSFGERICDDLCEEILQYLSFEDKLRLECVSKQFQRTVFVKHYHLNVDINSAEETLLERYETLFKKCHKIKSITFEDNLDETSF